MPDLVALKMLGVAGALSYAAARLAAKAGVVDYRRFVLVSVPLNGMPDMPRGFSVRSLSPDALAQYVIDIPSSTQTDRFAQGLTCLGAFNAKDELVGVTWVGAGPYVESLVHVSFVVPKDVAWDCGLWIAPRFRLGRGFAALWAGTAEWIRQHDRRASVSWIADYNLPSLLSHRRMGAKTIGHLTAFRLFRWQFVPSSRPRLFRTDSDRPARLYLVTG